MANRRYFKFSIDELERLFESSKGNRALLVELGEELRHRDRPRAKALAKKVADHLAAQAQTKPVEKPVPPTQFVPKPSVPVGSDGIASAPSAAVSSSKPPPTSPIEQARVVVKPSLPTEPIDFGDAAPEFYHDVETKPGADSILAAWLTLEVLTPQALPDARELETIGRTLVRLEEYPEPWKEQRYWRRGKERAVHWMVYLGELDLGKATKAMVNIAEPTIKDRHEDRLGRSWGHEMLR